MLPNYVFITNVVFGLNATFAGGASYLTDINNPGNAVVDTGVFDADSSTLTYSAATTPEPTSIITLLGLGVLGVASNLKKKA